MRVDHSDVSATSTKLPFKAANLPNKHTKNFLWSARFFRFVHFIKTSFSTSEIELSTTMLSNVWSTRFCQISEFAQIEQKMVS